MGRGYDRLTPLRFSFCTHGKAEQKEKEPSQVAERQRRGCFSSAECAPCSLLAVYVCALYSLWCGSPGRPLGGWQAVSCAIRE